MKEKKDTAFLRTLKKIEDKGFYIILSLCIAAIGVSGYVLFVNNETETYLSEDPDSIWSADSLFDGTEPPDIPVIRNTISCLMECEKALLSRPPRMKHTVSNPRYAMMNLMVNICAGVSPSFISVLVDTNVIPQSAIVRKASRWNMYFLLVFILNDRSFSGLSFSLVYMAIGQCAAEP